MLVTFIEAMMAFFGGVYFSVWGNDLTSPVWTFIMSVPYGGRLWGTVLLISGALFLLGLEWTRLWPRVLGCAITGLVYIGFGIALAVAPFVQEQSLSGSIGMWFLSGFLTLCLAGFMWSERHNEKNEGKYDWTRKG